MCHGVLKLWQGLCKFIMIITKISPFLAARKAKKDSDFESMLTNFCYIIFRALKDLSAMLIFIKLNIDNYWNKTNIKALSILFNTKSSAEL